MAYTAQQHANVVARIENAARNLRQLRLEFAELADIATNLASGGNDPAFTPLNGYTKAELLAATVSMNADLAKFFSNQVVDGGWRDGWYRPFLPSDDAI